jgi:hypothetical protein
MSWELKHPLQARGRSLLNRGGNDFQTVRLVVHITSEKTALVSLLVTDGRGAECRDSRLGECWIATVDQVGRRHSPHRLLQAALEQLLAQPGARLLPADATPPA